MKKERLSMIKKYTLNDLELSDNTRSKRTLTTTYVEDEAMALVLI